MRDAQGPGPHWRDRITGAVGEHAPLGMANPGPELFRTQVRVPRKGQGCRKQTLRHGQGQEWFCAPPLLQRFRGQERGGAQAGFLHDQAPSC